MSDILRFACGHCGKQLSVKPQHAGRSTRCPGCQHPVTVPHPDPAPSQPDNLNVLGVFAFHENAANASDVGEDTKSVFDAAVLGAAQPVSNPADVSADDAISNPPSPPTLAKVLRWYGALPRTAIIGSRTLLVTLVVFGGWYLLKPPTAKESFQVVLEAVNKRMKNEHPDVLSYHEPVERPDPKGSAAGKIFNEETVLDLEWWSRTRWTYHIEGYDIKATDSIVTPFTAKISYFVTTEWAHPIGKPDEFFKDKQSAISDRVEWKDKSSRRYLYTATFNYTDGSWISKSTSWPFVDGEYQTGDEVLRQ